MSNVYVPKYQELEIQLYFLTSDLQVFWGGVGVKGYRNTTEVI